MAVVWNHRQSLCDLCVLLWFNSFRAAEKFEPTDVSCYDEA